MKTNWKVTLAAMAVVGMLGVQPQIVLGQDTSGNTVNKQVESVVTKQDGSGHAVSKTVDSMAKEKGSDEKNVATADAAEGKTVLETKHNGTTVLRKVSLGTSTFTVTPEQVAEELALRKFLQEKKASFVEGEEENLALVGTSYTANRIPQLVITDAFVKELEAEAKARIEAKQHEPWAFPDVDVMKEKLEAIDKKKAVDTHVSDTVDENDVDGVGDFVETESEDTAESKIETDTSEEAKAQKHNDANNTAEHTDSGKAKKLAGEVKDTKDIHDRKQPKTPTYPIDLLWTDKPTIFLHEDVHVGATRGEVLFAWGAPQAMWRNNKDGSLLWLYIGELGKEKTITKNKKSSMQKEEFSQLVKNSYTSDSLAGSNSSVGYVWLSLKDGKVTHLGMITGQDWPRFAIPATTLETFKPNTMTESDFSLMGYRLGDTFTNDPNRSWEERGKLYGQEFLGYKDVVIAYNKEHEITRVMINSSLGTTKRGISLGDSKYLLLYLYGVPDFEEPANQHDNTKGVVYGYRHPVLEHTYLLFTLDDKFIREILLSTQKKSELVSSMKSMAL
ncbi:hypothetical protein [Veillonella sp. VA142]|uniref:hypothetical protein n=1 Tax=Veillonella sp. VA142 TaxID=741834 RepID=UPI000F8F6D39|nr:hypothetical protein [Veillonella sp. VA142]